MSESSNPSGLCAEVIERMAEILDGTAPDELHEHVADCDTCRDGRHDAERARELAEDSSADYQHPDDLEQRVLEAIEPEAASEDASEAASEDAPTTERMDDADDAAHDDAAPDDAAPDDAGPDDEAAPIRVVAANTGRIDSEASSASSSIRRRSSGASESQGVLARLRKPRNTVAVGLLGAALAAAAVALVVGPGAGPGDETGSVASAEGWSGKVAKVSRAAGGEGGLELCDSEGEDCKTASAGDSFAPGRSLKTDDRTRAYLLLDDGTRVALDRDSELRLASGKTRRASLAAGAIVADVAKVEGDTARIDVAMGHVEVLGTKLALRRGKDGCAVDVSRGTVKLVDGDGREVTVRAGEEGRMYRGVPPYAQSAPALGEALAWSDEQAGDEVLTARGLGEALKARKPGKDKELGSGAVVLSSHKMKVRIVDGFARTEVEEVFSNTTDDVLEGIYRFPLPPDAQIERLALEVDGRFEEGAFVDRERAAKIWRGAIVNAARRKPRPREEIIWVPGPWKDPALLEWQRGGRFELRIYPIPKKGARKIVLTYTQAVAPSGGMRRYVYPLPHDANGDLRVGEFEVDVQVRGHDAERGVSSQGYAMQQSREGAAHKLTMRGSDFVPSGDLVVEYALADPETELTAWAYQPTNADLAAGADAKSDDSAKEKKAGKVSLLDGVSQDAPYLAMALRPKLPRWTEDAQRSFALVIDASRSMYGERYKRATALAVRLVQELDRLDRFTVLACDSSCRVLPGGMRTPGAQSAGEAKDFLAAITPEGGSDLTEAVRQAASAASASDGRALRVVYIGDGTPTVGPILSGDIEKASRDAMPFKRGSVTAVAIGADADLDALAAFARGGGGVLMPYVPGRSVGEAAFAVLGASYGRGLRDVTLDLPTGLVEVAPTQLDTIAAGGEALVVARMTQPTVRGEVVLRGQVGDKLFEQRYQLDAQAVSSSGNAFVPRLFAAQRIRDLERDGSSDARKKAVTLSGRFNVASRYTSLLVLESPAMFKAFGLDNSRTAPVWTGEFGTAKTKAKGDEAYEDEAGADNKDAEADAYRGRGSSGMPPGLFARDDGDGPGGGGFKEEKAKKSASAPRSGFDPSDDALAAEPAPSFAPRQQAPPPPPMRSPRRSKPRAPAKRPSWGGRSTRTPDSFGGGGRRMVPMRRIWERKATINTANLVPLAASADAIAKAETELRANENRRDAVTGLYKLLMLSGNLDRAATLAQRWSDKEALDPAALTARADVAARRGDRELAIRILGSVVDVRPGNVPAQQRLARLHRWAGRPAVGCRHSIAIAQLKPDDGKLLGSAVHCARKTGEGRLAESMLLGADAKVKRIADAELKKLDVAKDHVRGEIRLTASWEGGGQDLDVALIHPDGHRVSWLGAPTKELISAKDVTSTSREELGLLGSKAGEYVVEVVRGSGEGRVSGSVQMKIAGDVRVQAFTLEAGQDRLSLASFRVRWQSRLVRAW